MILFDHFDIKDISDIGKFGGEFYDDLADESQEVPFFRWWRWTPNPAISKNVDGIFVAINKKYDESILELPLHIAPFYGTKRHDISVSPQSFPSFEREFITPHDNFIIPSPLGTHLLVTMKWGNYAGRCHDLNDLFTFFCELRKAAFKRSVKGKVTVGTASFEWTTHVQLLKFLCKFAARFFEDENSWNQNP